VYRIRLKVLFGFAVAAHRLIAADPEVPVERARNSAICTFYLENDFFGGTDGTIPMA